MTIAERLTACGNRPAGFDYMRLILASAVVFSHVVAIVYSGATFAYAWEGPTRPLMAAILPMFFALSGFLVAGSLERCKTMISFLGLRIIRLIPALAVDTAVAALLIGPFFTTLPIGDYLRHPMTHAYALNILGDIHFNLPGVFVDNPLPKTVNGQLWTLPWELACYGSLTVLALLGIIRHRAAALAVTVATILAYAGWFGLYKQALHPHGVAKGILVECFLVGTVLYMYRDRVPHNFVLFAISAVATVALLLFPVGDYFVVPFASYVTVYLGLLNPHRIALVRAGDYSYGLYLYGYPIQQAVVSIIGPGSWVANLVIGYALSFALAVFSWWCVEKPALRLRPYLYAFEKKMSGWAMAIPFGHLMIQPPVGKRLARPPAREIG